MSDLDRLADDYNAMRRERDEARAALDEREADMHARIRAGYDRTVADSWRAKVAEVEAERDTALRERDEARAAAQRWHESRDERNNECNNLQRYLNRAARERDEARSSLDALRVELLETQHEIGEAWFAGGVDTPAALRRKTAALERLGTQPMRGAKLVSHLLRRLGHLREALKAAASSIETIAEGRVDGDALPHQQDMREVRAYATSRASVARKALMEDDTDAMPDAARVERMKLSGWIKRGGPCVDGDTIYGPYQDACDMIAYAIERGEPT